MENGIADDNDVGSSLANRWGFKLRATISILAEMRVGRSMKFHVQFYMIEQDSDVYHGRTTHGSPTALRTLDNRSWDSYQNLGHGPHREFQAAGHVNPEAGP